MDVFSDDDLARLKEALSTEPMEGNGIWSNSKINALLSRLNAAEDSMLTSGQLRQMADWIVKHGDLTNAQLLTAEILRQKADKADAWRKASGKGGE